MDRCEIEAQSLFFSHIHLEGGPAPVRRYLPILIEVVLRPQLEVYEALCDNLREASSDVALAWVLHNPVVTAAISRPRTLGRWLLEEIRELHFKLSLASFV